MSIKTQIGPVTAYADAVKAGYTGTREQWAEDMAKLGENVAEVRVSREAAEAAAQTAIDARDTAVTTINTARDAAVQTVNEAAETAENAAVESIEQAASEKTDEINAIGAVRFDGYQPLTADEQTTARSNIGAAGAIAETAAGNGIVTVNDSAYAALRGLRIFGRSTQDGTPSPDAPVPIVNVGDKGTISVSITETGQTLTHATPNGLPGIPVTSGGNYTDASGQQWVCDEVDFGRGVYVKRVDEMELANAAWTMSNTVANVFFSTLETRPAEYNRLISMCDIYTATRYYSQSTMLDKTICCYVGTQGYSISLKDAECSDVDALAEKLSSLKASGAQTLFKYCRYTPIETPLTEEELAAYRALRTQFPITNVINDEGADMEVSYVADTKTYIDNKFAELSAAILNA